MNNQPTNSQTKTVTINGRAIPLWKFFLFATIGFFSLDAVIGIFMILFGSVIHNGLIIGQIAATAAILGLFSLLTMNNIFRRESRDKIVKISSTAAIIFNIVWIVPWLLIVWNCFDPLMEKCEYPEWPRSSYDSVRYETQHQEYMQRVAVYNKCMEPYENAIEISWKLIANGIIVAIYLTLLANYTSFKSKTKSIIVMKMLALISGAILAIFLISQITINNIHIDETTAKLLAILGIVFIFCLITTPILVRAEKKKRGKNDMIEEEEPAVAPAPKPVAVDEAALRQKIEAELRPKIEAELREKIEKEIRAQIAAESEQKTE